MNSDKNGQIIGGLIKKYIIFILIVTFYLSKKIYLKY